MGGACPRGIPENGVGSGDRAQQVGGIEVAVGQTATAGTSRFFITDAIMNGLPPHIAQIIVGHPGHQRHTRA
jgi:hypothetical protein